MYRKLNSYDVTLETLETLNNKLDSIKSAVINKSCFLGFDGYIDSLYSLVQSRTNAKEWKRMTTMKQFGELLVNVSGSSANIERILKKRIFGGFAPNTARAMSALGVKIYLVAALGIPNMNSIYKEQEGVESMSISNPGETLGLEFDDGKVMITDFTPILKINWNTILKKIKRSCLIEVLEKSDIMGFGHWALVPNLNDIWQKFLNELFPSILNLKEKIFFVDIADIRKRSRQDILDLINILQKIDHFVPVMLSTNDLEAYYLSKVLDNVKNFAPYQKNSTDYVDGGKRLNAEINLSYLVIHSPHFATISTKENHYWITEGYTSKPKYTVSAGDYFHSGAVIGLSCGLTPPEAILLGNALTAIFVRTGSSPNVNQLSQFISRYMEFIDKDNPNFP
jgi:sugar/nucleoside kinase (ribokinase family)